MAWEPEPGARERAMQAHLERRPVPAHALAISIASLIVPVVVAFWLPSHVGSDVGTLIWLTALIPAFLLAYYRGLAGVAIALADGMAVITATQLSLVIFDIASPNWPLLAGIVGVYLGVSVGIAGLAEVLRRERGNAESLAMIDRLTGIPNRRYADMVMEQEFAAAARGSALTLVIFDLDRFKSVNDRFGHAAGDDALQAFAQVLQTNTRKSNLSARFGGEEFISVLRDTDPEAGAMFAQRVRNQTRALEFRWGRMTVSAGVAAYEDGMGTYELLVGAADRALYQAKEGGRDAVFVAPPAEPRAEHRSDRALTPTSFTPVPTPLPQLAGWRPAASVYVVDDDPALLFEMTRVLSGRGYEVWGTSDPAEAILRFAEAPSRDRPSLIITDVIMPTMTGMRMIEQIVRLEPDVKVVYLSAYVHGEISWTGMPGLVVAILEKPIVAATLRKVVDAAVHPVAGGVPESVG